MGIYAQSPGGQNNDIDLQLAIGKALLKQQAGTTSFWDFSDDFLYGAGGGAVAPTGWASDTSGTGGQQPVGSTEYGGVYQWFTGATAASKGSGRQWGSLFSCGVKPFYVATRLRFLINGGAAAQSFGGMGIMDNFFARSMLIGYSGGLVAANYSLQHSGFENAGSGLDLGLALDTSFHVFEFWSLGGTTIYARVDGRATVSATASYAGMGTIQGLKPYAYNGTDAINKQMECNWVLATGAR